MSITREDELKILSTNYENYLNKIAITYGFTSAASALNNTSDVKIITVLQFKEFKEKCDVIYRNFINQDKLSSIKDLLSQLP